jgi:hypothetical protein
MLYSIQLIGLVAGGGIISTTLFVDSVTLTTFILDSSWSNLEQLIIAPLCARPNQDFIRTADER